MNRRTHWANTARALVTAVGLLGLGTAVVIPDAAAQSTINDPAGTFTNVRSILFSGLANQVGSLPNPTGGGFTFTLDPALGVFTRTSDSFGPVFVNRAETTGQGKFTINATAVFDYPTIGGLAEYLVAQLPDAEPVEAPAAEAPEQAD